MALLRILLTLSITSPILSVIGLKLINNGYENLYIVIEETVPESEELLDRIQEIFTDASVLLYKATHKRAYFRSVKVIIPKTWTKKGSYSTVSALTSTSSHIKVGNSEMKVPHTVGNEECGQSGIYTYLPYKEFFLWYGQTFWGKHDSVIVHEWGHLRWGLKDEYPTVRQILNRNSAIENTIGDLPDTVGLGKTVVNKVRGTVNFYQADGEWKPVGCSRDLKGYASTQCNQGIAAGNCDQDDVSVMMEDDCKYCPELTQLLNASMMGFQYIPSVVEFCDKDDVQTPGYIRHNSEAINEQNIFCDGKSAWEVIREHEDFKDGNNPPLPNDEPPPTQFQLTQEISDRVRVLVLDTSGSMSGQKISDLYDASEYVIETILPQGSWLGIIDFDHTVKVLSQIVQIDSESTRQALIKQLPTVGDGGTCIPCGLDTALSILNSFSQLDSLERAEVILISDGQNGAGSLEEATQNCVDAGVVVHCVTLTESADQRLVDIASKTGGRIISLSGLGSVSLAATFSELISSAQSVDSRSPATMKSEHVTASQNVPVTMKFNIDEGLGSDTTVSIIAKQQLNIEITLAGPNVSQSNSGNQVKSLSLVVAGVSQPGLYAAEITISSPSNLEVIITSKPTSQSAEIIRPLVKLSSNDFDFTTSRPLPVMYVYLRKGQSPVKKATVEATVEGPNGAKTCVLILLDNGVDPDIKSGDGIYSAVILRQCQAGNGRHSSKVIITGTKDTVVTHYISSGSAFIDLDTNVENDTATGNFERVALADAYTVSNYDVNIANTDTTPPGRIVDVRVIDIQSDIPTAGHTRNYTITWTATGDDSNIGKATTYEMRISNDQTSLRHDFLNAERLTVSGVDMAPNVSGKVERLQMTVSSNDAFTSTTYFAIVAIDEAGNRGPVSNIIPITIGLKSQFEVIEEECTDNCYDVVKDCGTSFKIIHGRVNFTNADTRAGNSVPVICDIGYELKGDENIMCLQNGKWNGTVTCEIVGCGGISIANGEIDVSQGTDYNTTATVKCSNGYHLIGGDTVKCMATGEWNKSSICEINDCGRNVTIPHGRIGADLTKARTTYGQSFPVICDTGYKLSGGERIECRADGTWSSTVTCKLIDCGATSIVNGQVDHSAGTHFNTTVKILCNSGYWKTGPGTITCLLSGTWSTDSNCSIEDCGNNVTISNGYVNLTGAVTTYGESLLVYCNTGYELKGGTSVECDANGRWKTTSTCKIKDCGSISIANGEIDLSAGTKYNAVGTIHCDDGYWINGSAQVTCLSSGLWNFSTKCVRKDCGDYVSFPNGVVDFTNASTTVGHSLPITCETGYELNGGTRVECRVDGQWSTTATCDLIDCLPTRIANGEVQHTSSTKYNATASVNCHAGYRVQGSGILVCLATGRWSNGTKCIIKDCGRSERIANGHVVFTNTNTTYGTFVPVTCDIGYKLKGGSHIECLADGTWSKRISCQIVDCGIILIPNGIASLTDGTKFNATANVTCSLGFRTGDTDHIVCQQNGFWSDESPCKVVDCGSDISITNGRVNFIIEHTSYGHSANVVCDTGFKLTGSPEIICLAKGTWSTSPACEIIDCGNNVSVSNGRATINGGWTTFGSSAEVICDKGYRLKGTANIICLGEGTWSTFPVCEIVDCGNQVIISNGRVNFTGARTTYGQSVKVVCDTGFLLNGPFDLTCSVTGRWSELPVCELVDCGNAVNITNGHANFTSRNTTYGHTVPVVCNAGYKLRDSDHITCLANGFWSMGQACDAIDVKIKSEARINATNIVTIVASSLGLVALVIIGLLILTVIRTKHKRLLRKRHTREIPPDYSVDESMDDSTFPTNRYQGWYMYNARGFEHVKPVWNWKSWPIDNENSQWRRY